METYTEMEYSSGAARTETDGVVLWFDRGSGSDPGEAELMRFYREDHLQLNGQTMVRQFRAIDDEEVTTWYCAAGFAVASDIYLACAEEFAELEAAYAVWLESREGVAV